MSVERIYLDTSVLLSVFLGNAQPYYDGAMAAVSGAQAGDFTPVISALVVAEAVGAPNVRAVQGVSRSGCKAKQRKAHEFMDGLGALYVELGERHGRRAAELSQRWDLKGKDALHLAAAIEAGCQRMFSCDTDLLKVAGEIPDIKVVLPDWTRATLPLEGEG